MSDCGNRYVEWVKREEISELHYIARVSNIESILKWGILSHSRAARLPHESVANQQVQDRRAGVKIPNGMRLHDYANLYFNGRNPMMYSITKSQSVDEICLLRVASAVLDMSGTVVTDCNAASNHVMFSEPTSGLDRIERDELFATYWTHPDQQREWRHKSRMCAEVLVPHRVAPARILGAYVGSETAVPMLTAAAPSLNIVVDAGMFFV